MALGPRSRLPDLPGSTRPGRGGVGGVGGASRRAPPLLPSKLPGTQIRGSSSGWTIAWEPAPLECPHPSPEPTNQTTSPSTASSRRPPGLPGPISRGRSGRAAPPGPRERRGGPGKGGRGEGAGRNVRNELGWSGRRRARRRERAGRKVCVEEPGRGVGAAGKEEAGPTRGAGTGLGGRGLVRPPPTGASCCPPRGFGTLGGSRPPRAWAPLSSPAGAELPMCLARWALLHSAVPLWTLGLRPGRGRGRSSRLGGRTPVGAGARVPRH